MSYEPMHHMSHHIWYTVLAVSMSHLGGCIPSGVPHHIASVGGHLALNPVILQVCLTCLMTCTSFLSYLVPRTCTFLYILHQVFYMIVFVLVTLWLLTKDTTTRSLNTLWNIIYTGVQDDFFFQFLRLLNRKVVLYSSNKTQTYDSEVNIKPLYLEIYSAGTHVHISFTLCVYVWTQTHTHTFTSGIIV